MPNYTKKVINNSASELAADEEYLGATYALPAGRFGRSVGFGAAGVVGSAVAEYSAHQRRTDLGEGVGTGMSAEIPEHQDVVLAVTNKRLLVFSFGRMKGVPKDLIAEYQLDEVTAIDAVPGKLMTRLTVSFADGSLADFEAQKIAKPGELTQGFERATGRS